MSMYADMHTHSEFSHDSTCKIEEMAKVQMANGANIFAVTDHVDIASYQQYDIFSNIKRANDSVTELNKIYGNKCKILSGVEIGEGFWYPEVCDEVLRLIKYDVVLGSVHFVRYQNMRQAYSQICFSDYTQELISEYLDAYFDDVLTMINIMEFDILCHLTCPLRYINGKYKKNTDIRIYGNKIKKILHTIIEKGIALEVNTSSWNLLGDFMPTKDILEEYYKMGGRLITIGSDAHRSEDASQYFEQAIQTLKAIGYKDIYYFMERKPYQIKL